jgi:hypothetical protein
MRYLIALLVLSFASYAAATTIESPKKGQVFKRGEKITCAGTSDEVAAFVIDVKNAKNVTCGGNSGTLKGGPWTLSIEPPQGGWRVGEYTIELHNARRKRVEATVKIKVE